MKSANLNFLEPSGPLQACNGTALPLPIHFLLYSSNLSKICVILFKNPERFFFDDNTKPLYLAKLNIFSALW